MNRPTVLLIAGFACIGSSGCAVSSDTPGSASSSPDAAAVDKDDFRQFEIDGAEVWTRSALAELPQAASAIEISATLIDSGDGPELCWSGVDDSRPPQCGGPVVNGLDDDWWSESAGGVHWGGQTVTITWPPVDNAVELIDARAPIDRNTPNHPTRLELPRECADIETFVDYQTLRDWEDANPDRNAEVRVVEDATIAMLAVDGDLDAVRAELQDGDVQACVVSGYSRAELQAAQDDLLGLLGADVYVASTGGGHAYDRVTVDLLVADRQSVQRVAGAVEDPDLLLISGIATIVDGD